MVVEVSNGGVFLNHPITDDRGKKRQTRMSGRPSNTSIIMTRIGIVKYNRATIKPGEISDIIRSWVDHAMVVDETPEDEIAERRKKLMRKFNRIFAN